MEVYLDTSKIEDYRKAALANLDRASRLHSESTRTLFDSLPVACVAEGD